METQTCHYWLFLPLRHNVLSELTQRYNDYEMSFIAHVFYILLFVARSICRHHIIAGFAFNTWDNGASLSGCLPVDSICCACVKHIHVRTIYTHVVNVSIYGVLLLIWKVLEYAIPTSGTIYIHVNAITYGILSLVWKGLECAILTSGISWGFNRDFIAILFPDTLFYQASSQIANYKRWWYLFLSQSPCQFFCCVLFILGYGCHKRRWVYPYHHAFHCIELKLHAFCWQGNV